MYVGRNRSTTTSVEMTETDNQYLRGALVVTGRSASLAYGRSRSSGRPGGLDTPTVARSISR